MKLREVLDKIIKKQTWNEPTVGNDWLDALRREEFDEDSRRKSMTERFYLDGLLWWRSRLTVMG